nr:Gfo/Idh/MocA family oxidoreductase [uncultured Blautia sp.]
MGVKVAILGAGNMGKSHARRLKDAGAEVLCVCDKNPEARAKFLEEVQDEGIRAYSDFDEMLEKEEVQALFICIPPFAQDKQFEKAAAKGIHVFIEKPIALTTEVGKRMVHAAEENHIITHVGFHMRQGVAVKKLKQMLIEGKTGKPVLFHGHYSCNSLHTPWWIQVDLCGGQIFEQAIHVYDMCRHLMGNPKYAVGIMNNLCHNDVYGYSVEDVSASVAGFTNGAIASITANNCEIPGLWIGRFKAVYEKLTVDFTDHNHAVFTYTGEVPVRVERVESEEDPYVDEVEEFLACIQEGKDSSCNIQEGYKSLCYVEKVVESAKMDGMKVPV